MKNEAKNVEPQVKEEIPGPRDRVTGFESVLHNRQVTERNLEMIFNSIGPKRVRLYAIDDLVTVFNASVKPESLRRKEGYYSTFFSRLYFFRRKRSNRNANHDDLELPDEIQHRKKKNDDLPSRPVLFSEQYVSYQSLAAAIQQLARG